MSRREKNFDGGGGTIFPVCARVCTLLTKPLLKQAFAGMMGKETKWGSGRLLVNSLGEEVRAVGSFLPPSSSFDESQVVDVRTYIAAVVDMAYTVCSRAEEKKFLVLFLSTCLHAVPLAFLCVRNRFSAKGSFTKKSAPVIFFSPFRRCWLIVY